MATATDLFDFLSQPAPAPSTATAHAPSPASIRRAAASVFRCPYCPRRFTSGQALGGHQNAHRRDRGAVACPYLRLPRAQAQAQAQPPGPAAAHSPPPGAGCTAPPKATAACDVELDLDLHL